MKKVSILDFKWSTLPLFSPCIKLGCDQIYDMKRNWLSLPKVPMKKLHHYSKQK